MVTSTDRASGEGTAAIKYSLSTVPEIRRHKGGWRISFSQSIEAESPNGFQILTINEPAQKALMRVFVRRANEADMEDEIKELTKKGHATWLLRSVMAEAGNRVLNPEQTSRETLTHAELLREAGNRLLAPEGDSRNETLADALTGNASATALPGGYVSILTRGMSQLAQLSGPESLWYPDFTDYQPRLEIHSTAAEVTVTLKTSSIVTMERTRGIVVGNHGNRIARHICDTYFTRYRGYPQSLRRMTSRLKIVDRVELKGDLVDLHTSFTKYRTRSDEVDRFDPSLQQGLVEPTRYSHTLTLPDGFPFNFVVEMNPA